MLHLFVPVRAVALTALVFANGALGATPAYHTLMQSAGPRLWYQFNETSGTTVVNHGSLGAAFNGVMFNGVVLNAPTASGDTGVGFDLNTGPFIESLGAAPAEFTGNPSFSCEAVVRVTATVGGLMYPPFLHWGTGLTGREVYFSLYDGVPNRFYAGFYNGGVRTMNTYATGEFHHYVWVRNAAGGAGQHAGHTLYVDGQVVAIEADDSLPGASTINVASTTFRVQKARDFFRHFSGTMDEVALFDRLLTPAEVMERYQALALDCPGDADHDGDVDFGDLNIVLSAFNQMGSNLPGDLNGDGAVNFADLNLVLSNFNTSCL